MNSRESHARTGPDPASRAEALLRALAGVAGASVDADPEGIVRGAQVLADGTVPPREVARNVQSALYAALGIALDPGAITVAPKDGKTPAKAPLAPRSDAGRRAAPASGTRGTGAPAAQASPAPPTRSRRPPHGRAPRRPEPAGAPAAADSIEPAGAAAAAPAAPSAAPASEPRPRVSVRLARVDLEYPGPGRVAARVTLAAGSRILVGDAAGEDSPAGRLDVVARAVISARPAADTFACELEGVRLLDVAGRPYAFVALRTAGAARIEYRADTALADGPVEHAVALATLGAMLRNDHPRKVKNQN